MSTEFIIFFIVFAIGITFCEEHFNDEMYCKRFHQKFQICRKCPNVEEDCEKSLPSDSCQCDHIQLYKQAKSLYVSRPMRIFYGIEFEIWTGFGPVGSTENELLLRAFFMFLGDNFKILYCLR